MILLLSFFWFIRTAKVILFWLYLWQLKEYHIGRFLDHFRTSKGKQLLFNKLLCLKVIVLLGLIFPLTTKSLPLPFIIALLLVLYSLESTKGLWDFLQKKLKKPALTKKTALLILTGLLIEALVLFVVFTNVTLPGNVTLTTFWLLVFDILTPAISSVIVLGFQPLAVLGRNRIIKKAKEKRAQFKDLLVIGITGSYGKTSTKEFLAAILEQKYKPRNTTSTGAEGARIAERVEVDIRGKVLKTKEHQNSEVGISQCILNDLGPEHQIFICEMGAYNRGGIKLLCDIVKPKIGILTGINEQHMATFGSQENIVKAKFELIESLPEDGVAFFNAKNKYCLELYQKTKIKKNLYGNEARFPGEENILGAMAVARELGMSQEEISRVCEKIENRVGGFQLKKGMNNLNIIDATYSANPDGVISHLEYLKIWSGRKVIVMPCLIELGKASKEVHKRIGEKIGEVCDLAIITTKERFKEIKETAISSGLPEENILFIENPKEIFEKIRAYCKKEDVVLLESRVPGRLIGLLLS